MPSWRVVWQMGWGCASFTRVGYKANRQRHGLNPLLAIIHDQGDKTDRARIGEVLDPASCASIASIRLCTRLSRVWNEGGEIYAAFTALS